MFWIWYVFLQIVVPFFCPMCWLSCPPVAIAADTLDLVRVFAICRTLFLSLKDQSPPSPEQHNLRYGTRSPTLP